MESGAITNGQVSASSIYTGSFAGYRARLHSPGGSWVSLESDINQWLEIDLITQRYISVTRVATQGRYNSDQWVTKYKLQYLVNEKEGPQYYREQGQNTDKVIRPHKYGCAKSVYT